MSDNNFGFYTLNGQFHNVVFPTRNMSKPPVTQLLGVNDRDIAVGFFNGAQGNSHAFEFSIRGGWFRRLHIPGAVSSTATGINNRGEIVGFFTNKKGKTFGFVITPRGTVIEFNIPGASSTMAFGVNDFGAVVGTFMRGSRQQRQVVRLRLAAGPRRPGRQRPAGLRRHHAERHQQRR